MTLISVFGLHATAIQVNSRGWRGGLLSGRGPKSEDEKREDRTLKSQFPRRIEGWLRLFG